MIQMYDTNAMNGSARELHFAPRLSALLQQQQQHTYVMMHIYDTYVMIHMG